MMSFVKSMATFRLGVFSFALLFLVVPVEARVGKKVSVKQCFDLVFPNLNLGHIGSKNEKVSRAIAQTEKELDGLSYSAIVAWEPKKRLAVKRFFIEKGKGKMDFLGQALPKYDKNQKLGKATMSIQDIRWSQSMCRNSSQDKKYSVINNAKAFKEGTLTVEKLPTIRVWRDTEGRVWTLDHRRLAAMRLSGVVDKIQVEFVAETMVKEQAFKFSTQNEGRSILVHIDDGETPDDLSIVLINEGVPLK